MLLTDFLAPLSSPRGVLSLEAWLWWLSTFSMIPSWRIQVTM